MKFEMKQRLCMVLRPICFYILLMLVVLSLAGVLIPSWTKRVSEIQNLLKLIGRSASQELFSRVHKTADLFSPLNASVINFARMLTSWIRMSHISYMGSDGLFFAYYREGGQPYALYSNTTFPNSKQNDEYNYTWYMQPVNCDTGKLYGAAIRSPPSDVVNSSWFQNALNSTNGYASVGTSWGDSHDIMLIGTVGLDGKRAVSLGFPMKPLIDILIDEIAFYNGSLYLATMEENVVINRGFPNTRIIFDGGQVSFHLLDQVTAVGNISCQSCDSKLRQDILSIWGRKYEINCLTAEIWGLQFVYVLAQPQNASLSLIQKNKRLSLVQLILMIGGVTITICIFSSVIVKAARRDMYLCGALINQMEATQQSERKSMNKSLAFASASHDIRASLAGISGLIEICRDEVTTRDPLRSELLTNLLQMDACTRDLLGILNSILDTSKIEAGKMQLEEEEFDMEQLLEDVVDLYHPVGMKKGVDVILDPHDCSVLKSCNVTGDRGKLKQILSNLLSNAVKFTADGHETLRAWAKKPSLGNEMMASNRNNSAVFAA